MEQGYLFLAILLIFFLAFANGGNDISKSIATLAGAGLTSIRKAILWGTVWTILGALSGLYWGSALIKNISESIYTQSQGVSEMASSVLPLDLALAVCLAPIVWVLLATWRKWPVSTTHAIVGGLVGGGLFAYGIGGIAWSTILTKIALPLLASPIMAIALALLFTPFLEKVGKSTDRIRLCLTPVPKISLNPIAQSRTTTEPLENCLFCHCDSPEARFTHGITLSLDHLHWLTSGLLAFSRGLNDTPKLIAIVLPFLLVNGQSGTNWLFIWAALAMGAGSWMAGRKITQLLGYELTRMNHAQGFSANLISAVLVIGASRLGLPVSTTHVSASSIMGVGLNHKNGLNIRTVKILLFAWLVTAPMAGLISAFILWFLTE